ncbi:MAG: histidinol-phosphate transaminase [Phycisphaerae bacterium]|nr:histidinol-phosphate transaminase [Phycisphaerae bacterium]
MDMAMKYFLPHISKLEAYTPGEQINAPGVIKLNTNENPYPPSPQVVKALARLGPDRLRKYPQPYADDFRVAAAEVFGLDADMILPGNGGDELLRMIAMSFIAPGQAAAAPYPTYTLYEVLVQVQNAAMTWVDWPEDYSLPLDELAAVKAPLTFLANPNAPTGTVVECDMVAKLARRLEPFGVLVVDEAYFDFAGGATCLPLVREHPNVIILRTLSKGYCMAGLRFGYAVACRELIAGLRKVKDSYNCDAISIALATAAIKDQKYRQWAVDQVVAERDRMSAELTGRGWNVLPSRSNFILVRPPDGEAKRRYEALKRRNILVRYFGSRRLSDKLRITIGTPAENSALLAAIDRM